MYLTSRCRILSFVVLAALLSARVVAADEPALTKEQIKQFLKTAKIIHSSAAHKGTSSTMRLTLSDGTITHDAHFQPIDDRALQRDMANGQKEFNFVDSYKYNIAAYELAAMLGLDDLVPVYVERNYDGKTGSLGWWLPVQMDEGDRLKRKIPVPDAQSWNEQMYRVRVFDQLVYDTDANLTNVLIGQDWKVYRIDFSRAFRIYKNLQMPKDLVQCDRQLLAKLKALDGRELATRTKGFLSKLEVEAVMARRDKIVDHFQKLIAEKGEAEILY
jgi:hypothetical protein